MCSWAEIKSSDVPPRWPAPFPAGSLARGTYELVVIDTDNISVVVNRLLKVNSSGIVDKRSAELCEKAAHDLGVMHEELGGMSYKDLSEVDWSRIKQLQFQDVIRQRALTMDRLKKLGCVLCEDFDEHVRISHPSIETHH